MVGAAGHGSPVSGRQGLGWMRAMGADWPAAVEAERRGCQVGVGPREPRLVEVFGDAVEDVKEQWTGGSRTAQGGVALAREVAEPDGNSPRGTHAYRPGIALAVAGAGLPGEGATGPGTGASSTRTPGRRTLRSASRTR